MPLYQVRLESPVHPQYRLRTFEAPAERAAVQIAEQLELNRCAYSILSHRPDPLLRFEDERGLHAQVNCDALAGLAPTGHELLELVTREHHAESDGKIFGPNRWYKAHLDAHLQTEPYRVAKVDTIDPTWVFVEHLRRLREDPELWDLTLERLRGEGIPIAVVSAALYGLTWQKQIDGSAATTVWTTSTIQCSLHSGYTMNQDADDFFNDVSGTEVPSTGGYTANGVTIGSKTTNYTPATDLIWLDGADASWTSSTISATDAIVWNNTAGASSTDPLLGAVDFGATVSTSAGTFQITWDANGIINFDVT